MNMRRAAIVGTPSDGQETNQRKRSRTGRYVLLALGSGIVSGVASMAGIWPFGGMQTVLVHAAQIVHPLAGSQPIQAGSIFPPVPPVHRVIDVYDPAPPQSTKAPAPPEHSPEPKESPKPQHSPHPTPTPPVNSSPSPSPHDD
jgi:hypothetical protein